MLLFRIDINFFLMREEDLLTIQLIFNFDTMGFSVTTKYWSVTVTFKKGGMGKAIPTGMGYFELRL